MYEVKCACCKEKRVLVVCLYCGQALCGHCFTKDYICEHQEKCAGGSVAFLCVRMNYLFITTFPTIYYVTGAPYLDCNNNDNIMLKNNESIYLNGGLLNNLLRHLIWRFEYKMDMEKVIEMRELKKMAYKDIADDLGRNLSTIKSQIRQARAILIKETSREFEMLDEMHK